MLLRGAAWGPHLGHASSGIGLLIGTAGLAVGAGLLIGGNHEDAGGGAAKAALGVGLLLVLPSRSWSIAAPAGL